MSLHPPLQAGRLAAALLAATALAGCATAPAYHTPQVPAAAALPLVTPDQAGFTAAPPPADWWRLYRDPVLDGLVTDALAANTDVRQALARIERARASLRGARADELPSTSVSASAQYGRAAENQVPPGGAREGRTIETGISIGYEVDLFGRVRNGVAASRADLEAARQDADAVRVTVVADTVRAYVDATAGAEQLAVAQRTLDLLTDSARITQARFDRGLSDRLDVIRVTQLLEQQRATLPQLQARRDAALFRLATLTGRAPQDLPAAARERTITPDVEQPIPVGDGRALLARRPDVKAAERRLAADTARIGVARADLYPRITLGGSAGVTSVGPTAIFAALPFRWLVGSLISWDFLNREAVYARIGGARADAKGDLARFDGTVLRALEETQTALSAYRNAALRRQTLVVARDAAQNAARISTARQKQGQIDFLALLDAQRTLAQSEADLAEAKRQTAFAQVDLFRALGGNWQGAASS